MCNKIAYRLNLFQLSKEELVTIVQTLLTRNDTLVQKVVELAKRIENLERQVLELKSKKDSSNSSMPPSHDQGRAAKSKSLRKKSGRSRGGQPGHKGHRLEMTQTPVQVIEHVPGYCQVCGEELGHLPGLLAERRQVVDIPPIAPFS